MKQDNDDKKTMVDVGDVLYKLLFKDITWDHAHGFWAVAFVISCLVAILHFTQTSKPNYALGCWINLIGILCLITSFTSRRFNPKIRSLNKHFKRFFIRLAAWNFAFSGLMISFYTFPPDYWKQQQQQQQQQDAAPPFVLIATGTGIYALGTLVSTWIAIGDIASGTILKGTVSATTTTTGLLVLLPIVHASIGTKSLMINIPSRKKFTFFH